VAKEREKEKRRSLSLSLSLVSRVNSIFDCLASRHSRLRQGSKIDYSSITLRLVPSFTPPSRVRHASPSTPALLPSFQLPHLSSALSLLIVFTWTHRTRTLPSPFPLHLLREASSSPPFRSSVIASRSRALSASRGVP